MTHRPTARQIVEQMVLPASVTAIVLVMRKQLEEDNQASPELDQVHSLLEQSLQETAVDISPDQVRKLTRRSKRVVNEALSPLFDKYSLATQYLTLAYFIAELTREDLIYIGAESPFAMAWDIMSEVMDIVVDKLPEMDEIATVEARNLRSRLAALGYFIKS